MYYWSVADGPYHRIVKLDFLMRVGFLSAEKEWKKFNAVFAPLKPSMVTSGDLDLAALSIVQALLPIRTGGLAPSLLLLSNPNAFKLW